MAARAPSAQPLSMDRPGSISNRQLSGVQTPPTNEEGQRGAVALASGARGPMNTRHMGGRGGHPPMGSSGLCSSPPPPPGGAPRRVRFIRAAAAVVATAEEDVGYARAGGSAGPERAA